MAEDKPEEKQAAAQGEETAGTSSALELLQSATKAALPVVVSALVSVGFVAFAGKAILWTRFNALQVPGDQVVKAVPQGEAVAIGASLLLIFGLLGVLATVAVYLVDRAGRATAQMSRGLLVILGVEATVAIWHTHGKPLTTTVVATEFVVICVAAIVWSTFVAGLTTQRKAPGGVDDQGKPEPPHGPFYRVETGDQTKRVDDPPTATSGLTGRIVMLTLLVAVAVGAVAYGVAALLAGAGWGWVAAAAAFGAVLAGAVLLHCIVFIREEEAKKEKARKEAAERAARESPKERKAREKAERKARRAERKKARRREKKSKGKKPEPKPPGVDFAPRGMVLVLPLTALIIAVPWILLGEWWLGLSLGVVALLGWALWQIASLSKERFVWYGLAVFISVPLFGTVMLMASNADEPKVQPMAMIRETDGPNEAIQGLYVTEADQRIYFANLATEGCENKVTPNSGRLLWVPKKEVVAMSVGPLQGVKEAGKAALEMSYDLTPAIETGSATFTLAGDTPEGEGAPEGGEASGSESPATGKESPEGEEEGGEEGEEEEETSKARLKNVGPAVRPNFGAGLRIEPEVVSPGDEATLRMSAPNEEVEGFGPSRAGHNLRLGGKVVDIAKEKSGAAGAEYVETKSGRLIDLDKQGAYVRDEDGDYVLAEGGDDGDGDNASGSSGLYVRLNDPAVLEVGSSPAGEEPVYVPVVETDGIAKVAPHAQEATLAGGTFEGRSWDGETVELEGLSLLRQAWHEDHIKFHVPEDATTNVVTVECDQLAGSPLLQVSRAPQARLAVQMRSGSAGVLLYSRASSGGEKAAADTPAPSDESSNGGTEAKVEAEPLTRRWRVDGVLVGHGETIPQRLAPRMRPYAIELTVVDENGNADTAKLEMLRLPAVALRPTRDPFLKQRIRTKMRKARKAIEKAAKAERPKVVEIDGYTDSPGKALANLNHSLGHDEATRERLLRDSKAASAAAKPVRVEEFGHGETCPIYNHDSRANLHVDVFVLHDGVIVKPTKKCRPHDERSAAWRPPPGKTAG